MKTQNRAADQNMQVLLFTNILQHQKKRNEHPTESVVRDSDLADQHKQNRHEPWL